MIRKNKIWKIGASWVCVFCLLNTLGLPGIVRAGQDDVSHQTHLTAVRGPGLGADCLACHTSGTPSETDVDYNLCIPCHSPDGAYDGLNDASIGARYNWGTDASEIYDSNGSLKVEKRKWCVGCHDDGNCVIKGVQAPNITGLSVSGVWETPISIVSSTVASADNLLDGNLETGCAGGNIIFDLSASSRNISHIRLYTVGASISWEVYGSNDLNTWTKIVLGQSVLWSAPVWGTVDGWNEIRLDKFIPFRYLKLNKVSSWPVSSSALREFEFKENLQYGYYTTGHRISCDNCHDTAGIHIDGISQTYQASLNNYQIGYRLNDVQVDGQIVPSLEIPRVGCNADPRTSHDFALCFTCHDKYKLLGDAYGSDGFLKDTLQTNFRNDSHLDANGKVSNEHLRHLRGRYYCGNATDWDSDWDGVTDSPQSCPTCHNVHGSPSPAMTRHGELTSTPGTADKAPMFNLQYINENDQRDTDLLEVTGSMGATTQFYAPGPGWEERNKTCKMCHNDQVTYYRTPVSTCGDCHAEVVNTQPSHSIHFAADPRGPCLDCYDCHAGSPENRHQQVFADGKSLAETTVCNNCHSPDGAYDGVSDPVIGAKNNWQQGVYQDDALRTGKEKWCVSCHDDAPANSKADGSGIYAPSIAGDNTTYGFYVNGHKSRLCSDCHDLSAKHIDEEARTYAFNSAYYAPSRSGLAYASGYRLRYINGQVPLMIPANYNITFSYNAQTMKDNAFRLCFNCHQSSKILDNTPGDGLDTNFKASLPKPPRNYSYAWGSGADVNEHVAHILNYIGPFCDSDWDTATTGPGGQDGCDSMTTCSNCHNVHGAAGTYGSTNTAMIRDGSLVGRTGYGFSYVVEDTANGGYPMVSSAGATQSTSVGAVFRYNTSNMCAGSMCHGNPTPPAGSSYNASGSSWGSYLEYYRPGN